MMRPLAILLALLAASPAMEAQNFTSILSGNWSSALTWAAQGTPDSSDNVLITNVSTVTVTANESCNDLNIFGELQIEQGGSLNVFGDLDISSQGGELDVNDGSITIYGDIDYDGSFDIDPGSGNFVELKGDLYVNGDLKLQVLSGSLIIYSNLEFNEGNQQQTQ